MIRVVAFLVIVGVLALGGAWFADRPGGVEIVWLGYRITTSVAVLAAAIAAIVVVLMVLWRIVAAIWRSPGRWSRTIKLRRAARGQRAISRGLIAVGAGDMGAARKFADEAKRYAGDEPLTLLLSAQSAQLAGDRAAAEQTFGIMAGRADLKSIGLHGLYIEAQRRGDAPAARALAEEAANAAPSLGWAGRAVLEFRCASGAWNDALTALDRNMSAGLVDKATYRRQRAVLLTAQALADNDRDSARRAVLEAAKLAPDLVPAAALAGQFLAEAGEHRKAARVIEAAWQANPHPDLAAAYVNLRPADSARERLSRAQRLAKQPAGHVEGALTVARAAIEANEFAKARAALAPLLAAPTQRVAMLMSEIEEADGGDIGRARAWTARAVRAAADPVWTADGYVSEVWLPVSPSTGRLDAFEWRVPVSALPGTVIDASVHAAVMPPHEDAREPVPLESVTTKSTIAKQTAAAGKSAPAGGDALPSATRPVQPVLSTAVIAPPVIEAVIPLVHAPDDPGPEPMEADEPVTAPKPEGWQQPVGWQRLRALFR